jgi:hypothetical protein|nr:MAG TPA: major capsid protein [Caudoviricetes sp.]
MANENTRQLTFDEKVQMFKAIAENPQSRSEYAQSRAKVILPLLDAQSTIRNIFVPEYLPAGAQATYDIPFDDVDCAWVMPQIGGIPQIQVEGTEVYVTTFGIDAAVQWQMDVATQGRFQVGERATQLLKNKIIEQEELAGWSLIKAHAASLPAEQILDNQNGLTIDTFNNIVTAADVLRRKVTDIYISPKRFADMRKWVTATDLSDKLKDQAYVSEGLMVVWGVRIHKVYDKRLVGDNEGFAFGSREGYTYGVMPIRQRLRTYENPIAIMEWKIGIMARQIQGFAILDDKGLIYVKFA